MKRFVIKTYDYNLKYLGDVQLFESPAINILLKLNNIKFKNDLRIDWLIKCEYKKTSFKPYFEINKERYVFWISTSSQMKKSEAFFVREDKLNSIAKLEDLLSTGKLKELKGEEISINKDIISRLSLSLTGCYRTGIKPNVIIIPDIEMNNYKDVEIFENGNLKEIDNYNIKTTLWDGCGIASKELFERIAKDLGKKYVPSWVTIRIPKMAVKGLLTNVNFIEFFNDFYNGDTELFKRENGCFYIKDVFGQFQKVDDNTIIIPESMAKWAKFYNSMDEYNKLVNVEYKALLECLYVAKVGKEFSEQYTRTSYQSLSALCLTKKSLYNMTKEQIEFYKRCMSFDKIAIFELLNNDIEKEDESSINITNKILTLLQINFDKFINLNFIKKGLLMMLDRKIRELSTGKFLIEGSFKVMTQDPITFMNYIMTGDITENLKEREFYIKGMAGTTVGCVRYPVASPTEITKENIVYNEFIEKYCNYNEDIIVFPVKGISALIKSGK